jgi:hypothetical protein
MIADCGLRIEDMTRVGVREGRNVLNSRKGNGARNLFRVIRNDNNSRNKFRAPNQGTPSVRSK